MSSCKDSKIVIELKEIGRREGEERNLRRQYLLLDEILEPDITSFDCTVSGTGTREESD